MCIFIVCPIIFPGYPQLTDKWEREKKITIHIAIQLWTSEIHSFGQ